MVRDPDAVTAILRGPSAAQGQILPYLDQLEAEHGLCLPHLRAMACASFLFLDGAQHLKLRRLVAPALSERSVAALQPAIDTAVASALDRLCTVEAPDLMLDFAEPACLDTFAALIGFTPSSDTAELMRIASDFTRPMQSLAALARIDSAIGALSGLLKTGQTDRRGLLGGLAGRDGATAETGTQVNAALSLLVAGHTIAQTLGFALYQLLLQPPEVWTRVAAPDWAAGHLERLLSASLSTRTLVRQIPDGCAVVMDIVAANAELRRRCPAGATPATLTFGTGAHKCPGEALTRRFLATALPALARRCPVITLDRRGIRHHVTPLVQYPERLPCRLDHASDRPRPGLVAIRDAAGARSAAVDEPRFAPPALIAHLDMLAELGGEDFPAARRLARNALFFLSGPRHAAARRLLSDSLGKNRITRWQAVFDAAIAQVLQELEHRPEPDLVADFALPLFRATVQPVLGVTSPAPQRFDALSPELQDVLEPWLPLRDIRRIDEVIAELLSLMAPVPAGPWPAPPLLAALDSADPAEFDAEDRKALVLVLYGAGFNLPHTLGNLLHLLLCLPPETRLAPDGPVHDHAALDRLLGFAGSPDFIYRQARRHDRLGDLPLAPGDTLRVELQPLARRSGSGALSFGHGLHRCLGASLSRQVILSAVPALFTALPGLEAIPQAHRYLPLTQTTALATLPCRTNRKA